MKATLKATLTLRAPTAATVTAAGEMMTITKAVLIRPGESTGHLTKGRQKVPVTRVEFEGGVARRAERPEEPKP